MLGVLYLNELHAPTMAGMFRIKATVCHSPKVLFEHYRELVTEAEAKEWFSPKWYKGLPVQNNEPFSDIRWTKILKNLSILRNKIAT